MRAVLQSHLYGIEIYLINSVNILKMVLQSHLYGIEIKMLHWFVVMAVHTPIAPLWNWNYLGLDTANAISANSNRTFMELKYFLLCSLYNTITDSNRTFMELKFLIQKKYQHQKNTPIAPLWNWNKILGYFFTNLFSYSNRTFMELKCNWKIYLKYPKPNSNRTFMELKLLC